MQEWCRRAGLSVGAVLSVQQLFTLAQAWYAGRIAPDWAPRSRAESQHLLTAAGLTGEFWSLTA